nr:hypothetical protein BaRGS_027945 [Batillaria attramentaria]
MERLIHAYGQCVNHVDWVHQGADFIFAELKLSSCSFATGEKMNVQVAVKNESQQVHITGALCNIERVITHGRGGKKTSHTRVAIHGGHVADDLGPGDGCQKTVNFPLKDQPPTGLLSRTDVSIDYRLKVL